MKATTGIASIGWAAAVAALMFACSSQDAPAASSSVLVPPTTELHTLDCNSVCLPPSGMVVANCSDVYNNPAYSTQQARINAYCAPLMNGGVFEMNGQCYCSGGSDPCGADGCNSTNPACACPAGKLCNAVGTCDTCTPKTCADFPNQCTGPFVPVDAGAGTDSGAPPMISDGCGGQLMCTCTNPLICTAGGVCAPAGCTATNMPSGPQGSTLVAPGVNFEAEIPGAWGMYLCKLPAAMGLPALSNKAKLKADFTGGWTSKGTPVCHSEDGWGVKGGAEAELCGYIFALKGSYGETTKTNYCPYCDLSDQTNKCTPDFGQKTDRSRARIVGEFGVKVELGTADLVDWFINKMKYKKTGTGEDVNVLRQIPMFGRLETMIKNNAAALNDLAKVKAELKISENGTRGTDRLTKGTAACASGTNCYNTITTIGPGVGGSVALEVNLPPQKTGSSLFSFADIISLNIEIKASANGSVQYGITTQSGDCGSKNCLAGTLNGNVGVGVKFGAEFARFYKIRGSYDMSCVGSIGYMVCDDLSHGPTPPEASCKINSLISTE